MPAVNTLNERLRDDYIADTIAGVGRWNKIIKKAGVEFTLTVPHKGFNRRIGSFAGASVSLAGEVIGKDQWENKSRDWLPTAEDRAYVHSLMGRVVEPGKFANWISPPSRGINNQPADFQYVRFN